MGEPERFTSLLDRAWANYVDGERFAVALDPEAPVEFDGATAFDGCLAAFVGAAGWGWYVAATLENVKVSVAVTDWELTGTWVWKVRRRGYGASPFAAPVSYTHLTLPTTPYV